MQPFIGKPKTSRKNFVYIWMYVCLSVWLPGWLSVCQPIDLPSYLSTQYKSVKLGFLLGASIRRAENGVIASLQSIMRILNSSTPFIP